MSELLNEIHVLKVIANIKQELWEYYHFSVIIN